MRKYRLLITVVFLVAAFDQVTKFLIVSHFTYGESFPIIPHLFNLTFLRNPGVAFGMMANGGIEVRLVLAALPVIALAGIAVAYRKLRDSEPHSAFSLSLIAGGAAGNLIDRLRAGSVVDFLDFHWFGKVHYPAFNLADTAICVGVSILLLTSLRRKERSHDVYQAHSH